MRFHKHFIGVFVVLFLSFNQQAIVMMEPDLSESSLQLRKICLSDFPLDVQVRILSFLKDQKDLLRAGLTSTKFRRAAEVVWKTKPLNLSNRILSKKDYETLAQGPFFNLILKKVNLSPMEISTLVSSSRFTHLDLSDNIIGAARAEKIAAAKFSPSLTALNLNNCSIGNEGAKAIAKAHFPLLTTLTFNINSIKEEGAKAIAAANFPRLTTLDLSFNDIGDEGAKAIAAADFPQLTTLRLSHNSIGNEGAKAIAAAKFPLTTVRLSFNNIEDEGAKALAAAQFSPLTTLVELRFNNIKIKEVKLSQRTLLILR